MTPWGRRGRGGAWRNRAGRRLRRGRVRSFGLGPQRPPEGATRVLPGETRGRLLAVGVVVLLLLGVLVGRLGQLQFGERDQVVAQAAGTNTRTLPLLAVRGRILDRHGTPLVANTTQLNVTMDRRAMSADPSRARESLAYVARLTGRDEAETIGRARLCGEAEAPPAPVCWNGSPQVPIPVALDVDPTIALTVLERPDLHPGLAVATVPTRTHPAPSGANAAHVLGYLGRVTQAELDSGDGRLTSDDLVGRSGLEAEYDAQLRGRPGREVVSVDPRGLVTSVLSRTEPVPGPDLRTSLDATVQGATERALSAALEAARSRGQVADSGAALVLDVRNGEVIAAASAPTYDPSVWTGGISSENYRRLTDPAAGHPLLSRVIGVAQPPASTIKALSVPAAVSAGNALDGIYDCPASYQIGDRAFANFESTAHPPLSFADALRVSCDTIFYDAAYRSWQAQGGLSQRSDAADPFITIDRAFGLGQRTGIDLPGEAAGSVPGREAKVRLWEEQKEDWCAHGRTGYPEVAATDPERAAYLTQIAQENCTTGYQYRPGDAANLSIGQGELATTPLQMAVAYAALANGGTIVTPRVGRALVDPVTGRAEPIADGPTRPSGLDPALANYVAGGLRSVVTGGTAAAVFAGMPEDWPVAGKTGTAEVLGRGDTSWFLSWAPSTSPRFVVAVSVSQGGTGSDTAAPAARVIHEALRTAGL